MNIRNFDLNLLVVFRDLYKSRSVSQSAVNLGMSQPAVSHALARLRAALDDELLIRSKRAYYSTEKGAMLGEYVEAHFKELESLLFDEEQWDESKAKKTFVLSGTAYDAQVWFPNLMNDLGRQAPGIKVNFRGISLETYFERMISGDVDLSFAGDLSAEKNFQIETLSEWDFCLIAKKDSDKYRNKISTKEYLAAEHVLYTPAEAPGSSVDKYLANKGKQRNIIVQTPYLNSIPQLVFKRDCLSILPTFFARAMRDYFPIKILNTPFKVPSFKHQIVWHQSRNSSVEHTWLRNHIKENYKKYMS